MKKEVISRDRADQGEETYNAIVKKRLAEWEKALHERGFALNYGILAAKMESEYHITTTEQKLRAMFSLRDTTRKLQLAELVALCHLLCIPLQDICELPDAPAINFDLVTPPWIKKIRKRDTAADNSGIRPLFNPYYCGVYHCYYFYPKHYGSSLDGPAISSTQIETAEVHIEHKDMGSYVTWSEKTGLQSFDLERKLDELELHGRLYLIEKTRQAYSFLTDPLGKRTVFLLFDYHAYSKDIMYYRTAAMLTLSRNEKSVPLFQKVAMFRVAQDLQKEETNTLIRGILALTTGDIVIRQSVFEKMAQEDPALAKIYRQSQACYIISEDDVLRHYDEDEPFSARMRRLMRLRNASMYQAHEIVREREEFGPFIKKVQQDVLLERQADQQP